MNILLDTNILIPFEDTRRLLDPRLAELRRLVDELGFRLYIHPAQIHDLKQDRNIERREIVLSRIPQYTQIPNPPVLSDDELTRFGWTQSNDNDRVDNLLLHAVIRGATNILISEDKGIRRKGIRAGIQERVYRLDQALDLLTRQRQPREFRVPHGIRDRYLHEFDIQSSFFDSLREGYDGFNNWYQKAAQSHRRCWCIADDSKNDLHAVCIYKIEESPSVTDDGKKLKGRALKLCTFKVGEAIRGMKIGERLLFTAFKYAAEGDLDWVYAHTNSVRHRHLIALFSEYGFQIAGEYNGDEVYAKPMRPGLLDEPESPLAYAIRYYPHYRDDPSSDSYLVPIRPAYHEDLFPDISNISKGLFADDLSMFGPQSNTIKKAYICNSNTSDIEPGDLLFFFRTEDRRSIEVVGVVETAIRTDDLNLMMSLVAKRTVYSREQLSNLVKAGRHGSLVILFRLVRYIEPISVSVLEQAGVKGPYQTIRRVKSAILNGRGSKP
jgi:hypothetical protein